jgi:hypothetical protein
MSTHLFVPSTSETLLLALQGVEAITRERRNQLEVEFRAVYGPAVDARWGSGNATLDY